MSRDAPVWVSPRRQGGEPCVMGTRIPTHTIAGLVWDRVPLEQIPAYYPTVTPEQALGACWYEVVHGNRRKWRRWRSDWPREWDENEWRNRSRGAQS